MTGTDDVIAIRSVGFEKQYGFMLSRGVFNKFGQKVAIKELNYFRVIWLALAMLSSQNHVTLKNTKLHVSQGLCLPNLGNDHIETELLEANLTRLTIAWSHELQKQYFQIKKHDWGLHKILRYLKKLRWKIHLLSSKSWQIKRKNSLTPKCSFT